MAAVRNSFVIWALSQTIKFLAGFRFLGLWGRAGGVRSGKQEVRSKARCEVDVRSGKVEKRQGRSSRGGVSQKGTKRGGSGRSEVLVLV